MSEVEQKEGIGAENFVVGELESVERANRRKLQQAGRHSQFAHGLAELFYALTFHAADEVFGFGGNSALHCDAAFRCRTVAGRSGVVPAPTTCATSSTRFLQS